MLQISTEDLTNFLLNKNGKLADWWFSELGLHAGKQSNVAQLVEWGIHLVPAVEFGKQFYWLEFQPTPLPVDWKGKYRKLLIKLVS